MKASFQIKIYPQVFDLWGFKLTNLNKNFNLMKLLFTVLFSIILGINTFAQDLISVTYEGYVKSEPYRERYKNNPQKLAEMEREFEAASKIPSIHILTMNKDEASFVLEERIQNEQPSEGLMVKVRFTASNIYTLIWKRNMF